MMVSNIEPTNNARGATCPYPPIAKISLPGQTRLGASPEAVAGTSGLRGSQFVFSPTLFIVRVAHTGAPTARQDRLV
jgi:hypothetical protein